MFIDKDSITINGMNMGKYLVSAEYQFNKLWGQDSGRNLAGEQSGTLLGVFPKFVLYFKKLYKNELENIVPILDSQIQNFRYYDPNKKSYITITTYTGDYTIKNNHIVNNINGKNEAFQVSFIATKKR